MRQLHQQRWQAFSRQNSFFANFIKPEKSDKLWRYERKENTKDGQIKKLIVERQNRKNVRIL